MFPQARNGELEVEISLPENYHLTKGANSRFEITTQQPSAIALEPSAGYFSESGGMAVARVQFRRSAGAGVHLSAKIYYCMDGDVCLFQEVVFDLPFSEEECEGEASVRLDHRVQVAEARSTTDF